MMNLIQKSSVGSSLPVQSESTVTLEGGVFHIQKTTTLLLVNFHCKLILHQFFFPVMNSAIDNTSSSTVQGGSVYNMAVEYHTPNVGAIVSDKHSTTVRELKPSRFTM